MLRFLSHQKEKSRGPSGPAHPGPDPTPTTPIYADDEEVRGLCDLYSPEPASCAHVRDLADVLLELRKITDEQYGRLRRESIGKTGLDPTTWLLKERIVGVNDVLEAKAKLNGLEFRRLTPDHVDKEVFKKLELDFIKRSSVVPVSVGTSILAPRAASVTEIGTSMTMSFPSRRNTR